MSDIDPTSSTTPRPNVHSEAQAELRELRQRVADHDAILLRLVPVLTACAIRELERLCIEAMGERDKLAEENRKLRGNLAEHERPGG